MNRPVEGWILHQAWGGIVVYWKVSGYMHPEARAVAVPYRVGKTRTSPRAAIPGLNTEYYYCVGRRSYLVDLNRVTWISPDRLLKYRMEDLRARRPGIVELLQTLNPEWKGLTGSWATLHESVGSDVDLLIYHKDGWSIYNALADLLDEKKISGCPGRHQVDLPRIHGYQLLDACYKGERYTIRILKTLEPQACKWMITPIGWMTTVLEIVDPVAPHTVPAAYRAREPRLGDVILETWHTRYQEMSPGLYEARLQVFEAPHGTIVSPDLGGWIRRARLNDNNEQR